MVFPAIVQERTAPYILYNKSEPQIVKSNSFNAERILIYGQYIIYYTKICNIKKTCLLLLYIHCSKIITSLITKINSCHYTNKNVYLLFFLCVIYTNIPHK